MAEKVRVPIRYSVERFTELHLEDGTILNCKSTVVDVRRRENEWDADGNPIYEVLQGPQLILGVVHVPGDLKKKG